MKTKISHIWERLNSSYWFLPILLLVLSIGLSFLSLKLDNALANTSMGTMRWIYSGGPSGARTLLSVIAGSMMTVAGVAFSITIVALTLASSQFGPRLLNNFMRDTGNQMVLGTFIATFMYCLLILGNIRSVEESAYVPQLSVTFGLIFALVSLVVLIYFIHHVSTSIHAENVIAAVGKDLDQAIERLFPAKTAFHPFEHQLRQKDDLPTNFQAESTCINSPESGYVQTIDHDGLLKLAVEYELLLKIECRPGHFVTKGSPIIKAGSAADLTPEISKKICAQFSIGIQRLRLQDVEFAINQLVEIAIRALSPGINDPFTAIACTDRLGVALTRLAKKNVPPAYCYDDDNRLRLVMDTVTFDGLINSVFNQIRQHGRSNVAVTIRLLETIASIGAQTTADRERAALLQQAEMIKRGSDDCLPEKFDREDVEKRFEIVKTVLQ